MLTTTDSPYKSNVNLSHLLALRRTPRTSKKKKRFRWHLRHPMNEIGNSLHSQKYLNHISLYYGMTFQFVPPLRSRTENQKTHE